MIEDYYDNYKNALPDKERMLYQNIKETQKFILIQVLSVKPGYGFTAEDIKTKEKFYINEVNGTFSIKTGQCLYCRLAWLGDRWELIGSQAFPIGRISLVLKN